LIAAVPFLLLAILVAAQLALTGQALWSAAMAARAGSRAALVGGSMEAAARRALPPSLRAGARIANSAGSSDAVSVQVSVPRLLPALPELWVGTESGLPGG
jgi:hypothetical protein